MVPWSSKHKCATLKIIHERALMRILLCYITCKECFKRSSNASARDQSSVKPRVKVGFSQKVMAKFSNLSNCHSCEPKIVPALLIPVNNNNKILAIL